ncbi:dioxygenase [Bosea sp. 117]|uniref:dioxygenase n=1 Tax=Bosea sp. 117 TaxID=1125973 RepID=UPI000493F2B3|nr:dioxygenase [Bosea sp. 117]
MLNRPDLGYVDEGKDLASPDFYAAAVGEIGQARVLPPEAYRSLVFSNLEDEAVWTRDWICIGSRGALPEVGDLLPFTVGTHGIHVQRTPQGLRGRFNKAQHGGCRMVPLQCQTGTKTRCSFTSCGYSRDRPAIPAGALGDGTPEMHQYLGLRPERLLGVHVRNWGPLIFVNLDMFPAAPEASLAALDHAAGFFGEGHGACSDERWLEFAANWKLVAQSLTAGTPVDEDETGVWQLSEISLQGGATARAALVFPNLVLMAAAGETCAIILQPTALGQTLCRVRVHGNPDAEELERWCGEVRARAERAVADHANFSRWGASHRPETVGLAPPLQTVPQGLWLQRQLVARVARVPSEAIEQPIYQNPRN